MKRVFTSITSSLILIASSFAVDLSLRISPKIIIPSQDFSIPAFGGRFTGRFYSL